MNERLNYTRERMDAMELVSQGRMLAEMGKLDLAAPMFEQAIEKDPMYLHSYLEQGNLFVVQDDLDRAMACYEKALLIDKMDGDLYFHIGNMHLLKEQFTEAIIAYAKAEEYGFTAPDVAENLALCYEQTEQFESALAAYLRAIRMNPDNPMPRIGRIQLEIRLRRYSTALTAAKDFAQRFPNYREGYEMLTDVLINTNEFEQAERIIDEALENFPDSSALMAQLARVYVINDKYDEAMSLLEKASQMEDIDEKTDKIIDHYMAHIFVLKEDPDGALGVYKRMIEKENGEVNVPARMAQMNLLNVSKRFEQLLEASITAQTLPECDGMLCMAYAMEPWALENMGKVAQARPIYEKAIQKLRLLSIQNASHMDTYMYRSLCYRGLGQYDEAIKQLKIYEDMGLLNVEIAKFKAQLYKDKGDMAGYEAEMARAHQLESRN